MKKPKLRLPKISGSSEKLKHPLPWSLLALLLATGLLCVKLLSFSAFGPIEQAQNLGSANLSSIKQDVLFAPIKAGQLFILKFTSNDVYIRLASVAVALAAAILVFLMLRRWYTYRVSLLTAAMFVTSSWFLHYGRLANLDVLYMTVLPALLLVCLWLVSKHNSKKMPFAAILVALTLYMPGSWLFIALGIFLTRNVISKAVKNLSRTSKILSVAGFIITLAPLIYSFALKPSQIVRWLGINTDQTLGLSSFAHRIIDVPQQLFATGIDDRAFWLTGTPILDIFSAAMFILGLYAFRAGYFPVREKMVFGSLIAGYILISLGNVVTLGLLIPLVYITIANGISYMLQSWFTVFPKNPIARSIGLGLMVIVISASCAFQLQRYFVSWHKSSQTQQALISQR